MNGIGLFYIDESIHEDAGFILAACCYFNNDPDNEIAFALQQNGFNPNIDEFKSSHRYLGDNALISLRESIGFIVSKSKIGLVIIPAEFRERPGEECIKAVSQFVAYNEINDGCIDVFLDEGMFTKNAPQGKIFGTNLNIISEQNSVLIRGLQLSDYIAHVASLQLKWRMGLLPKIVKGPNEIPTELGFEMWARLRYLLFQIPDPTKEAIHRVLPYGLYISEHCKADFAALAKDTFSEVYVGCIS